LTITITVIIATQKRCCNTALDPLSDMIACLHHPWQSVTIGSPLRKQEIPSQYASFTTHCHVYNDSLMLLPRYGSTVSPRQDAMTDPPSARVIPITRPDCHRRIHNWYDTDHGSAVRDWCRRRNIDTHPQSRKPRGSRQVLSLQSARAFSQKLQHRLFQTCLRHTMGHQAHVNPPRYGLRTRALTISARRRRRRSNKEGLSGSQVRRRQRKSPVPSFHLGGRSIFQSATTHHPIQVPSHAELI
jgi:hypothetical protein